MLVLLKKGVAEAAAGEVATRLRMFGVAVHRTDHDGRARLCAVGDGVPVSWDDVRTWPEVEAIQPIAVPFKLVSRAFHPQPTLISVGRCTIGSDQLALMAGPCSIEGEEQAFTIAADGKAATVEVRLPE